MRQRLCHALPCSADRVDQGHTHTRRCTHALTLQKPQLSHASGANPGGLGSSASAAPAMCSLATSSHTADAVSNTEGGSQDGRWPLGGGSEVLQKRRVKRQATWLVPSEGRALSGEEGVSAGRSEAETGRRGLPCGIVEEDFLLHKGCRTRTGASDRAAAGAHTCPQVSPVISSSVPTPTPPNAPPHAAPGSLSPATPPSRVPRSEWGRGDEGAPRSQSASIEWERAGKRKMRELEDRSAMREGLEMDKRTRCVEKVDSQGDGRGGLSEDVIRAMLTLGRRVEVRISEGMGNAGSGGALGRVCVGVITQRLAEGKFRVRNMQIDRVADVWNVHSCSATTCMHFW